ncbi:MAG: response regulator [Bdellovibrionota bacterium]
MSIEFTKNLDVDLAAQILKNVSTGLALFGSTHLDLRWCNATFKKQTWFGVAGRHALKVSIDDLFDKKDHKLIHDLFHIALSLGQAYDFQRQVKRGPVGSFPAEIKLHKIVLPDEEVLVCIEILDLSISKMYEELQNTDLQIREKMADLMAAQAELHHSVRMNTISEVGSDIAHQLINPITMCRGILETQILPTLNAQHSIEDMNQALKYMSDIQDLAIWFRRFSDPKISETQVSRITHLVNDALMLNVNRFTTQGITYKIKRDENFNPSVLVNPINFIMWLNASFSELSNVISQRTKSIHINICGDDDSVKISIQCECDPAEKEKASTLTLEKFAKKMPGTAKFESSIQEENILFSLFLNTFKEEDFTEEEEEVARVEKNKSDVKFSSVEKPLVFIVDDEEDIRRLIKRAMKQSGWETIEAKDGMEALEYFQLLEKKSIANRIVVIISDVRMPRMTGPHFLVALREAKMQIPFIFFSSNIIDKGEGGFKYENVYYLTKESGLEELKKLVGQCMPTQNSL